MTSKPNNPANPPAFPSEYLSGYRDEGMSLRDYFAAAALQGLLASFAGADCRMPTPEALAKDAFQQADAMLAERERNEE